MRRLNLLLREINEMEIILLYPNKEIVGDEAHKAFYVFRRNQH